jgi:hypothetical protein
MTVSLTEAAARHVTRYLTNPRAATTERLVAACAAAGLPVPTTAQSPAEALKAARKLAGARGAGATLFLMPEVHCEEAAGHIPDGLTVVPVTTLQGALDALAAWRAGETLVTCPTV